MMLQFMTYDSQASLSLDQLQIPLETQRRILVHRVKRNDKITKTNRCRHERYPPLASFVALFYILLKPSPRMCPDTN
jgi:hypothetical protein